MEGKDSGPPPLGSSTKKEEESSRKEASFSILPTMLSQELSQGPSQEEFDSFDRSPRTAPQAPPASQYTGRATAETHGLGATYAQPSAVMPLPTYAQAPGAVIPPSQRSSGHPPYSAPLPRTGAYSALPPPSATGMPPQEYPGYGSYPASSYGYGSGGQGYSYGTSASSMAYPSLGSAGSQPGYAASPQVPGTSSFPGVGLDPMYSGGAQAYQFAGSGYEYQGQADYGHYGQLRSRQGSYPPQPNRSWARNPGKPYFKDKNRSGPDGANLFVFHIPNDMTNEHLLSLFNPYGNVLSARIMTEEDTGRGRGFGFVSYDDPASAASAIQHLHGHQVGNKRLKVQHKQMKTDQGRGFGRGQRRYSYSPTGFAHGQQYHGQQYPRQHEGNRDQSPAGFIPLDMPVQGYTGSPNLPVQELGSSAHSSRATTPVLPPINALEAGSEGSGDGSGDGEDDKKNAASASPLADLQDIGKALPDT